tara:strand:- start:6519 stop:7484 length:966 start_codon:yes stop_codon:yes gene_type:complete
MSSIPTNNNDGTGAFSANDAVNFLLRQPDPSNEASQVEEKAETTEEEVVEQDMSEDENSDEVVEEQLPEEEVVEEQSEKLFRVKVDGEEYDVNDSELIKNYQLEKTAQKRLAEVSEERKNLETSKKQVEQDLIRYSEGLKLLERQLNQSNGFTQEQWDKLYENDPMSYMREKEKIREREDQIKKIQAEQKIAYDHRLAIESNKLKDLIPEWRDVQVQTKESAELSNYLLKNGFSQAEVQNASDSRIVHLARKAWLYDNISNKSNIVKKKVGSAPKMVKAGVPKGKVNINRKNQENAFSKLKKSGKIGDAVNFLLASRQGEN